MLSRIYADGYGRNIVLTRSFNHIGPRTKSIFVIPSFAKKLLDIKSGLHEPVISVGNNIEVVRDFVDVSLSKSLLFIITQGAEDWGFCLKNAFR